MTTKTTDHVGQARQLSLERAAEQIDIRAANTAV